MPGNSPGEAVENFLDPIKRAIQFVGSGHLHYRKHPPIGQLQSATLNGGEGLRVPAGGAHAPAIGLEVELGFIPIHCPDDAERGPYRCRSVSYILTIKDAQERELIAFHWHPIQPVSPVLHPHLHVGEAHIPQVERLHVPTPRVSVEEFLAIAIESFGAQPRVSPETWRAELEASRQRHEQYRSWQDNRDAPVEFPEMRHSSN